MPLNRTFPQLISQFSVPVSTLSRPSLHFL